MKAMLALTLALVCVPASAGAQQVSGPAVAIDGDTLDMTGMRIRLFGIDAVEGAQTCERGGPNGLVAWRCGEEAHALLSELVAGQPIVCEQRDTDAYGRMVSVCRAGRLDLAAAMAEAGMAIALERFSEAYLAAAERAKARGAGIWGADFVAPAEWRAAHPREAAPVRVVERQRAEAYAPTVQVDAGAPYFHTCDAARAAGAAPLRRGHSGYRAGLDRDGDGVACEPYYGR